MRKRLEDYFEFARLDTNWRTEILAGFTTFVTMAYIVLVNPSILADAGLPLPAVTAATCLSAAFGSIAWAVLHLATRKPRRQDWLLYVLAALFLVRFIYIGATYSGSPIGVKGNH